ncbi:MAG: ion transporter [Rhizobiales bacterium]|nr:ion transporter [Hyphomicrobiales bacterium]
MRKTLYRILERPHHTDQAGRIVDLVLIVLITINVISVTLETVDWIYADYKQLFDFIEIVSVAVFSIEYLLRVWSCVEIDPEQPALVQRLRYMTSLMALTDLLAIAPFYLSFFFAIDLRFLRVLRLLRIFKLTRYSSAMTMLLDVFREEANAFFAGTFILFVLLVLAASGAYLVEQDVQPEKFGSIPDAMWWAISTLTTLGYGDVTPITPLGKLFGACVAVTGIGMAALPAGILASGLADQLRRKREALAAQYRAALEDGVIDADEAHELEEYRKNLGLSKLLATEILQDLKQNASSHKLSYCPNCGEDLARYHLPK